MVIGSSISIIMKRILSGVDALSIWIGIVFVCSLWLVVIGGRVFLFMCGLLDIKFSSDDFNSFRHDVSDISDDIAYVALVMVTVNLYL